MSEKPVRGKPPEEDDQAWMELMKEARKTSLKSLEEAGKQLIGVAPILSGLYAAALSFAKIQPAYWHGHPAAPFVFIAPILFALASLTAGVWSMMPRPHDYNPYSPDEAREAYGKIVGDKYRRIMIGMVFLILSIAALLLAVWWYLGILASGQVVMKE